MSKQFDTSIINAPAPYKKGQWFAHRNRIEIFKSDKYLGFYHLILIIENIKCLWNTVLNILNDKIVYGYNVNGFNSVITVAFISPPRVKKGLNKEST